MISSQNVQELFNKSVTNITTPCGGHYIENVIALNKLVTVANVRYSLANAYNSAPGLLDWQAGSLPIKPSRPAKKKTLQRKIYDFLSQS